MKHSNELHTLPNLITYVRLALLPVIFWVLLAQRHELALALLFLAALGDALDGWLARLLDQATRLGALLDPIADKLTVVGVSLILAWQGWLPAWLVAAIVARDVVIVGGAAAYRRLRGRVDMAPTRLSKLNTALEFLLLVLVLAVASRWIVAGPWLPPLLIGVLATVVASGAQYVWLWGRKAWREKEGL